VALMDRVALHGIDVYAHHGVHAAERELGQRFVVDVTLTADCAAAAASDDLALAVDYAAVHARVVAVVAGTPCRLIETVATGICHDLLAGFPAERVTVTVRKPQAPIPGFTGEASVTLERDRAWLEARGATP
jgi:dihydroneopterin aldolase